MNKLLVDEAVARLAHLLSIMTADMTEEQMAEEDNLVLDFASPGGRFYGYEQAYAWAYRAGAAVRKTGAQMGG